MHVEKREARFAQGCLHLDLVSLGSSSVFLLLALLRECEDPRHHTRGPAGSMPSSRKPSPGGYDITKHREKNGYGIRTSMYSITHLGREDKATDATSGRSKSTDIAVFSKLHNASRKNTHMQVHYPETISKLQPPMGALTRKTTPNCLKAFGHPDMYKTRGSERVQIPYEKEFPDMAKTMLENTRRAESFRNENRARSTRAQISFG